MRLQGGSSRGLTAADVVNDGAKTARVRIDGAVNGVPFVGGAQHQEVTHLLLSFGSETHSASCSIWHHAAFLGIHRIKTCAPAQSSGDCHWPAHRR